MRRQFERGFLGFALVLICQQIIATGNPAFAQGRQFYVAPNGTSAGDGSRERPWDLGSALSGQRVPPGSTLCLRGGTYVGVFKSTLTGTDAAPITVRGCDGERAIVSDYRERAGSGTIIVTGAWTIYRDFEVTNTATGRGTSRQFRPMGFDVLGPHNKFINLVIHDAGHGIGAWKEAVDVEIYGNIIFNGGTQNELVDQGHGHGIYSQNNEGTKNIRENVVFNEFGWGIHIWPGPGDVKGYDIEGNVLFNNGILSSPSHFNDNFLISSHPPFRPERIKVVSNLTYDFPRQSPGEKFYDGGVCFLCTAPNPEGDDLTLQNNYFVGGAPAAIFGNWKRITASGNSFVSDKGLVAFIAAKTETRQVAWDQNRYYGQGLDLGDQHHIAFVAENKVLPFSAWAQQTGLDRSSNFSTQWPSGLQVFIRPNQYEAGRANIIIYNWSRQDRVAVDLRSVLKAGDRYVVLNVQDFLGEPVLSGTFEGKPVSLPMTGLPVAIPVGRSEAPRFTGPDFAVFVVRSGAAAAAYSSQGGVPGQGSSTAQDLAKFVGYYVTADQAGRIRVTLDSGRLVATILNEPNRPSYPLMLDSPTRFRLQGTPAGVYADFDLAQQKVRGMTLERGPVPPVYLSLQSSGPEK